MLPGGVCCGPSRLRVSGVSQEARGLWGGQRGRPGQGEGLVTACWEKMYLMKSGQRATERVWVRVRSAGRRLQHSGRMGLREGTADRLGERPGLGKWNSQAQVILVAIGLGSGPVEGRGADDTKRDGCPQVGC